MQQDKFQMALAKQHAGHSKEAATLYVELLNAQPESAFSYHNLGLIELESGNLGAALPLLWYATKLAPGLAEAHNGVGNVMFQLGRYDEAIAAFRRATDAAPTTAIFHFNLANALATAERHGDAELEYSEAIRLNPNSAEAHNNHGNTLRALKRQDDAIKSYKLALAVRPDFALSQNNLGNIAHDKGDAAGAETAYRAAIKADPKLSIAHFNLGNVLRESGRVAEAATQFRKAIELNPLHADAYRHLTQVEKIGVDDGLVHYMQSRYENELVPESDRIHFGFALGRIYDQGNEPDRAFAYLQNANRMHRKTLSYDIRSEAKMLGRIQHVFSVEAMSKLPDSGIADETPIFIVGMIRSGTTLMEQILASHRDVAGGGELQYIQEIIDDRTRRTEKPYPDCLDGLTRDEVAEQGESYLRRIRDLCGTDALRITDKMPQNFLFLGLIHKLLPKARIIYMKRDPRDAALSAFSILFTDPHPYTYDLTELGQYARFSADVMQHWMALMPSSIHAVSYEDLVNDLEATTRKVLDFCGLPFDAACLDFHNTQRTVATASAIQVREKLNTRSIGRWKAYERHLRDLKKALAGN